MISFLEAMECLANRMMEAFGIDARRAGYCYVIHPDAVSALMAEIPRQVMVPVLREIPDLAASAGRLICYVNEIPVRVRRDVERLHVRLVREAELVEVGGGWA